jgi:hypothetical protein
MARTESECPALGNAVDQTLLVETINGCHHCGIGLMKLPIRKQFPNSSAAMLPQLPQHLLLQWSKPRPKLKK